MIRIVQWTTGNVGTQTLLATLRQPGLELVGCYAWSEEKQGKDVGSLVGIDPIGIEATANIDALLALKPDCVCYTPIWP
ncbi:MAG: dihydrodipicolinate reductase, partial [Deltaproteobacteria bacterium]|nr:dihydrodipicolinate reductase [Deltaproteobacteria bacterium]